MRFRIEVRRAYHESTIWRGRNLAMESCRPPRGKPGPKPKGDRTATIVYLPTEFRTQAESIAKREGLPLTAIITRAVAEYLGEPAPVYCEPKTTDQQPELPLDKAS